MENEPSSKLKRLYTVVQEFLTEKGIETHEESKASRLHRLAHFWLLVCKSFSRNRCPLRATALAYTTLLALIPMLAIGFGVASSLLKEKGQAATEELIGQLIDAVAPQLKLLPAPAEPGLGVPPDRGPASEPTPTVKAPVAPPADLDAARGREPAASVLPRPTPPEVSAQRPRPASQMRDKVAHQIYEFINNAQSKTLGISGVVGLIVVAILLLSNIEDTFNDIWGVTRGRSWFSRIVQYWTAISLGPVVLALLAALVRNTYFQSGRESLETLPYLGRVLLPFLVVSGAFALFYKMVPNTQVHWRAATIAGIVGGSLWLMMNIFNALQLSRVVGMSKIYGSVLAVIPIFLVGLYFSWLIVLFGAQVAYASQNRLNYLQEKKAESVNQIGREFVALRAMTFLAQQFDRGGRPPTLLEIAMEMGVPSRLVNRVLQPLIEARLVLEVSGNDVSYAPAQPLEKITCGDILQTLRAGGGLEVETRAEGARHLVREEFDRIQQAEAEAASSVTLRDLVNRIRAKAG